MERFDDSLRELLESQTFWFPGTAEVVRFDADKQVADVQPFFKIQGERAPVIKEALVLLPAGGGFKINLHLRAGDLVAAMFCATQVALWRTGSNEQQEVGKPKLSNAIVLPAVARVVGNTAGSSPGVTIQNDSGTISIEMTDAGVKIKANPGLIQAEGISGIIGINTHTHEVLGANTGPPTAGT